MEKESMRQEYLDKAKYELPIENTKEDRVAIDMILELAIRFGLSQPHEVASILKVSPAEAQRLLTLAKTSPR